MNQIHQLKIDDKLVCFADDTVLIIEGDFWNEGFKQVYDNLKKIRIQLSEICMS